MFSNHLLSASISSWKLPITCSCICLIFVLGGCVPAVKKPYSPAFTEKRALVESSINDNEQISVLLLPLNDKREINDPFYVYKGIKIEKETLSEYLYDALHKDLNMIGFNATQSRDKEISFKEVELGQQSVKEDIEFVVFIEVYKCVPERRGNPFLGTDKYSIFDFHVMIWDNTKLKTVYSERLYREILGAETGDVGFYPIMVNRLLNEHLTIVNVDIAEILANLKT